MSKENENLNMSLFNTDVDFELHLDDENPYLEPEEESEEEEKVDSPTDDEQESEEDSEENDNNPNEDPEDPDGVVGKEDEEGEDDANSDSPNLYSSLANVLSEEGLLPSLDLQNNKIESIEDLTNVLKGEINSQVKSYLIEKIGEDGFSALEKGVSLLEYEQHRDNIETIDSIDDSHLEEDLELAKRVIMRDYLNQGIDEKRAIRLIKKTIDLGEESILEDAKESLVSLKEFEKQRLVKLAEEKEIQRKNNLARQEKIDNDLKNSIYNNKEFIKGIQVNKAIQDKVYKSITTIVGRNENGIAENKLMKDRRENPIEFDTKLYYLYEITNGFKDFSSLINKSKTSATKQLEDQLRRTKFEEGGKPAYMSDPESYGGIGSELVI